MGGTDDPSNIQRLTLQEHADAHRLLWEAYGKLQDKVAWLMLSGRTEEAEVARRALTSEYMRTRVVSDETKRRLSVAKKGKPNGCLGTKRSVESRQKMSSKQKEVWEQPGHSDRLSNAHKGKTQSLESRQRRSLSMCGKQNSKGHKLSSETKKKMSEAQRVRRYKEALECLRLAQEDLDRLRRLL